MNKISINPGLKNRLDLVIKELGMSGRAFEKECGLTNGSYSSIGDGVGADKLNKILLRFPKISAEWLICGSGKMMKFDDFVKIGSNFEGDDWDSPIKPLNREEMKTILLEMTGIVSRQQEEISRLITELEMTGKRSDRILDIIQGFEPVEKTPVEEISVES